MPGKKKSAKRSKASKASKASNKQMGKGFLSNLGKALKWGYNNIVKPIAVPVKQSGVVGEIVAARNPEAGKLVKAAGWGRRKRRGMAGRGVVSENRKVLLF
jgi:hypothetical protein